VCWPGAHRSCWPSSSAAAGLPLSVDRVYDSAASAGSWVAAAFRAGRVLQQYAAGSIEVLPRAEWIKDRVAE
jgi:hypothetical protein